MSEQKIYPSETILEDDYPVYRGYLYLVDGEPMESNFRGTVKDLKRGLQLQGVEVKEIRRCDLAARFYKEETVNG